MNQHRKIKNRFDGTRSASAKARSRQMRQARANKRAAQTAE